MTRSNSADDGPRFLSDLTREHEHLRQQQQAVEKLLADAQRERVQINRRLDAVENTLRAIGCRETDLAVKEATDEGRRLGQRNLMTTTAIVIGPIVIAFGSWFLIQSFQAFRHVQVEEESWRLRNGVDPYKPQMGPPVPPRLQKERKP
jgi:hypothetical protein